MIKIPFEHILEKLRSESELSKEQLLAKIEAALPEHMSQTDDKRIVRTPVLAAKEENRSIWGRLHTTIQSQGQITLQYQTLHM